MIINEYGLNCADPKVRAHVSEQCERYFFGGGIEAVPNHVPLEKNKLGKAVQPATPSLDIWQSVLITCACTSQHRFRCRQGPHRLHDVQKTDCHNTGNLIDLSFERFRITHI